MEPAARRARYSKVSTALAHLDDESLRHLLGDVTLSCWGTTRTVEVAGERVFVKVLPLTDLERDHAYSTRNRYRLPLVYQYGVGSAGFGTWREVVSHVETTNWVLEDVIATFPIAYHVRVVERPGRTDPPDQKWFEEYVRYWNSSKAVALYDRTGHR